MDYRKPVSFYGKRSPTRDKVIKYQPVERRIFKDGAIEMVLDIGCAAGWNLSRFKQFGRVSFGLDIVPERVTLAKEHGEVMIASGLDLPVPDETFDLAYIQHVLHHIGDVARALQEAHRCLKPGGQLLLIETTEDSPIIRWGRRLYPKWMSDEVNAPFYFDQLKTDLARYGFEIMEGDQYSVVFWIWEIFPDQWPKLEKLTPFFVKVEQLISRVWPQKAAHCYVLARKANQVGS